MRGRKKLNLDSDAVVNVFHTTHSIQATAKYFNCSESPIRRILREYGVDTSMYFSEYTQATDLSQEDKDAFALKVALCPSDFNRLRREYGIGEKRALRILKGLE